MSARPALATERVQLVCPRCRAQAVYVVGGDGSATLTCSGCGQPFATRVVRIRSKNSRGNKKANTRDFTVRVLDLAGRDELFQFQSYGWDDFELKSKDLAAFNYADGRLRGVQNLTLGRFLDLTPPKSYLGVGCVIVGLILLGLFMALCSAIESVSDAGARIDAGNSVSSAADLPQTAPPTTETFYIHGELNVRTAPNRNAALVRTLGYGEQVRLGPKDANGWAPVYSVNGAQEGYVYRASELVRSTPPSQRRQSASGGSASPGISSRRSSAESRGYYTGPRGGCYTYTASGRKRYVDRSYCN